MRNDMEVFPDCVLRLLLTIVGKRGRRGSNHDEKKEQLARTFQFGEGLYLFNHFHFCSIIHGGG